MDSKIVCRVAPDTIPIQRPFPLKFSQNEAEMEIPQRRNEARLIYSPICCHPQPLATPKRVLSKLSVMTDRQRRGVISATKLVYGVPPSRSSPSNAPPKKQRQRRQPYGEENAKDEREKRHQGSSSAWRGEEKQRRFRQEAKPPFTGPPHCNTKACRRRPKTSNAEMKQRQPGASNA
nr:hypothetical protein Iba_chr08bCG10920 [Ipomoea batatas]